MLSVLHQYPISSVKLNAPTQFTTGLLIENIGVVCIIGTDATKKAGPLFTTVMQGSITGKPTGLPAKRYGAVRTTDVDAGSRCPQRIHLSAVIAMASCAEVGPARNELAVVRSMATGAQRLL